MIKEVMFVYGSDEERTARNKLEKELDIYEEFVEWFTHDNSKEKSWSKKVWNKDFKILYSKIKALKNFYALDDFYFTLIQ